MADPEQLNLLTPRERDVYEVSRSHRDWDRAQIAYEVTLPVHVVRRYLETIERKLTDLTHLAKNPRPSARIPAGQDTGGLPEQASVSVALAASLMGRFMRLDGRVPPRLSLRGGSYDGSTG
jgi:hypothetical protein